jgi:hypothetical protein
MKFPREEAKDVSRMKPWRIWGKKARRRKYTFNA